MSGLDFMPYSASYPSAGDYKTRLQDTWKGYKERYIDPYSTGLVHDPSKADDPGSTGFNEEAMGTSDRITSSINSKFQQ